MHYCNKMYKTAKKPEALSILFLEMDFLFHKSVSSEKYETKGSFYLISRIRQLQFACLEKSNLSLSFRVSGEPYLAALAIYGAGISSWVLIGTRLAITRHS